jgi:hypothetical protein
VRPRRVRVDAQPREPQHRLRQLLYRRVAHALHEQHVVARGADGGLRRHGRVEHVEHGARRLLVRLRVRGPGGREQEERGGQQTAAALRRRFVTAFGRALGHG